MDEPGSREPGRLTAAELAHQPAGTGERGAEELGTEELIEEISIDGMCGVY